MASRTGPDYPFIKPSLLAPQRPAKVVDDLMILHTEVCSDLIAATEFKPQGEGYRFASIAPEASLVQGDDGCKVVVFPCWHLREAVRELAQAGFQTSPSSGTLRHVLMSRTLEAYPDAVGQAKEQLWREAVQRLPRTHGINNPLVRSYAGVTPNLEQSPSPRAHEAAPNASLQPGNAKCLQEAFPISAWSIG